MALSTQVIAQVPAAVQQRGRSYFRQNKVKIREGSAWAVHAHVRGTQTYQVDLERKGDTVSYKCTCPYYEGGESVCKHVWATLLTADARGHLVGDRRGGKVKLESAGEETVIPYKSPGIIATPTPEVPLRKERLPSWQQQLAEVRRAMTQPNAYAGLEAHGQWPPGRELLYVVNLEATKAAKVLVLEVSYRERKRDGEWSKPKNQTIPLKAVAELPDERDRRILAQLVGAREAYGVYNGYGPAYDPFSYGYVPGKLQVSGPLQRLILPLMCQTGRCLLREIDQSAPLRELTWDEGPPWELCLEIEPDAGGNNYVVLGDLRRGDERRPLTEPRLMLSSGIVLWADRAAALDDHGALPWVDILRKRGQLLVPVTQGETLIEELLKLPRLPKLQLPNRLRFEEVRPPLQPHVKIGPMNDPYHRQNPRLRGDLICRYDGVTVPPKHHGPLYDAERRRLIHRDPVAEAAAQERLAAAGFKLSPAYYGHEAHWELNPKQLPGVVAALLAEGWTVEAEGKLYRRPGLINIQVQSGIDWFELHGKVDFDGVTAHLPALLKALRRGENTVRLDDGTYGLLPEEWLKKYAPLAGLGEDKGDHLNFKQSQLGLLDALLAAQPEASFDAVFDQARARLRTFGGVAAAEAPPGFVGELRGYQKEGLGWLHFLRGFGFGGCLADDMGLGKTIQVLALLEARRQAREAAERGAPARPSLAVVPRSLIFNWRQEAAKFTPQLRILDHTGQGRLKPGDHFNQYDLILTTYGTLRRDILGFKAFPFDYAILDEAQAVKNADSDTAKATRLLRADYRLAMSGTPVENHLGELWSLFEFLNPGMLGSSSVFRLGGAGARNPDPETRELLAKSLRPFILRRTKEQVAKDLPQKTEQTLFCELDSAQRKQYDELREHYRQSLLTKVDSLGMNKTRIQVLEALLRLRQAACHPGLLDKGRAGEGSAKLDALIPQIQEVVEEGHKALVFSQFTSFLAIVRKRLDDLGIKYEYLDGRTRDRQARVERFQNDPNCQLFLVSLKAGGVGLNLTAAEYVFLLDPWWNPAVEAQAIDRAHRIGQEKPVFAYRLIARGTVEEKVLELQKSKRDLADAIINADNSLIRNLGREDLELLLS